MSKLTRALSHDYAEYAHAARHAVTAAAAVTKAVQANLENLRAITKDDKSPVTVADFAAQAVVAQSLRDFLGDSVRLVGEEKADFLRDPAHAAHLDATLAAVREVWEDCSAEELLGAIDAGGADATGAFWTLDPVDGTKGFLRNQQYAIALAFVESGTPVVGVMGCPNLPVDLSEPLDEPDDEGCLYWCIRGDGVYETAADDAHADSVRITRLDHAEGEEISVCASVEAAHSNADDTDRILAWLREHRGMTIGEPARLDSQCKYAVVARGQADAYLRLPTKKGYVERIWDHAAGALIAAEAGAAVTDIAGRDLDFSHGRGLERNRGVICAPPRLHGAILAAIADLQIT
jgi:3'(2'), 5'-bisphosphate nucleotidase